MNISKSITSAVAVLAVVVLLVVFWDRIKGLFAQAGEDAGTNAGAAIGRAATGAAAGLWDAVGTGIDKAVYSLFGVSIDGYGKKQFEYQPPSYVTSPGDFGPIHSPDSTVIKTEDFPNTPDYQYTEHYSDGSYAVGGDW